MKKKNEDRMMIKSDRNLLIDKVLAVLLVKLVAVFGMSLDNTYITNARAHPYKIRLRHVSVK